MRRHFLQLIAIALALPLSSGAGKGAPENPLLGIMQRELQRNFELLKKEPVPPYFMSYVVHDVRSTRISTSFGALVSSYDTRDRTLDVDVRVGDYDLDNTRQIRGDALSSISGFSRISLPLTDDDKATRAVLWRVTDRRFKQAIERLTKVKTNIVAKVKEESPAADFSRESPETYQAKPVSYAPSLREWEQKLRRISAPFAQNPLIFRGDASLSAQADNRYFVSSEETQLLTGQTVCRLAVSAVTKATDGMELPLYASYFSTTLDGLPKEEQILADVREMIDLLDKLRAAPVVDPYTGPAILSGRAGGVFFHEIFGHRVEGHRQKNTEDAQTFTKKVGQQILSPFISVLFDPTLQRLGNVELSGNYLYDDEGVKARRVVVVEKGILKTFLMSRSPLANFAVSNGHGRCQPGYKPVSRQSNLVVESSEAVPYDKLMEMLKEECRKQNKPFGLLFQNIEGGFTFTGRTIPNAFNVLPNVVFRIYTDGRAPELVRGVDLIGTPLTTIAKIVKTGDRPDTFNGICGAESGGVPVSASSPALLISEVEVQKKAKSDEPLPILPAPGSKTGSGPTF